MDRVRVWPDFRQQYVLYEDDDLLAVHKPAGVPNEAAQRASMGDLAVRVRSFLAARDRVTSPYLGAHERLDRETSGVVLFTKRPDVDAAVARQFEARTVTKRYLAAVSGWSARARDVTLEDQLRKGEGGRMEIVSASRNLPARGRPAGKGRPSKGDRAAGLGGSQRAVTHVTVRARNGSRALLDLRLATDRTHQARVQLANVRAPIAGDTLYGGALASRFMVHVAGLELDHPRTGRRVVLRDAFSLELERWVDQGDQGDAVYDDAPALDRAFALAVERRWDLGRSALRDAEERQTTAFRVINEEGDGLPGLAVDVYGEHLVAQLYVGGVWDDVARRDRVLDRLHALGFEGVYLKLRPKQANTLVDTRRDDLAPALPVRGKPAPAEIEVREEGVPYRVRLGDGLSTGIFLDQRPNRSLVRAISHGARVLNLFAYTCAFSVVAALGGAVTTVSVDASALALERGRANFEASGITLGARGPGAPHSFVAEDVFAWLSRAATKHERFDLVVVDPPSYSSTKKRRFVAESDYGELVEMVARVLAPHGKVLACCNHRGLTRAKLRRFVGQGLEANGRELVQLEDLPDAPDFPALGREAHMKSVLGTVT